MREWLARTHWHLWKAREHPGIHAAWADLQAEIELDAAAWQARRDQRLRELLQAAASRTDYYNRMFRSLNVDPASIQTVADLPALPLLTKDILRTQLDELTDASVPGLFANATGGSTGTPVRFHQTPRYRTLSKATDAFVREWWGVSPFARTASIWGADRDFPEWTWRERLYQRRSRERMINAFRTSESELVVFLRMLQGWRPPYFTGYASALDLLAATASRHGLRGFGIRAIRSSAEQLLPEQRLRIEDGLGAPVFNFYGSREINNLAAECPQEHRLHLVSTWRHIEVVDAGGAPLPPGEEGHLAVTDMSNYGTPFVRYLIGDVGAMADAPCACGRPSPVLDRLLGRSADVIQTPDGTLVHGEFFTHLFYGRDDVSRFQVHQTALDTLRVRVVPAGTIAAEFGEHVLAAIRQRMGPGVAVTWETVDDIPVPASGKHRFTISDVKLTLSG